MPVKKALKSVKSKVTQGAKPSVKQITGEKQVSLDYVAFLKYGPK